MYKAEEDIEQVSQKEKKHLIDAFWAFTAKQSVSKLARKELQQVPGPSLATTFGHLRSLADRGRDFGDLRAFPVQVITWERPAQTITAMLVYTLLCLRPQLLACIPLASILLGVFVPNYMRKFPMSEELLPMPTHPLEYEATTEKQQLILEQRHERAERDVVKAVREAQLSIGRLCEGLEKFDKFKAGPGNFESPGASCALYLILLFALINLAYLTSFVNIPQLFIATGWLVIIVSHPYVKAYLAQMEPLDVKLTLLPRLVKLLSSQFEFNDPLISRQVEIFELQKQGLTPRIWDTVVFTPYVYSSTSPYRLARQYPPGSLSLIDVECPTNWSFHENETWTEDPTSLEWIRDRRVIGLTPDGPWAYDIDGEWRRRRLVKRCYYDPK